MTTTVDEAEVLNKIQETYVPFLKKLIAFLEKNKKTSPENISKLNAIYTIFTTASSQEQIDTFHANKEKLEHWYNKTQKEKRSENGEKRKKRKQSQLSSDTESSQGASETTKSPEKKRCIASSLDNSESSNEHSIPSEKTVPVSTNHTEISHEVPKEALPTVEPPLQANAGNIEVTLTAAQLGPTATISADDTITFTCASCQFQTNEESEYMKHARANHKTDLSLWCKECGKCFSNAGVLVNHIKERACIKEEMIYRCGAKDCSFETTIGQTFVHHLRHCHKRSPFIFCVHCQKIFTLPHCLILHMQDDCPHKQKNRKNFDGVVAKTPPSGIPKPVLPVTQPKGIVAQIAHTTYNVPKPVVQSPIVRPYMFAASTSRGRRPTRGRGRGRGRSRISDSSSESDIDDPDDPLWLNEDSFKGMPVRRSARWAKKMNDVMNPESPSAGDNSSSTLKTFTSAELNSNMINCPCCDFMAAFQSVLEDHYIATHKLPNKNACLVCHLKFEDTRSFLDHFEEHRKGALPSQPPSEAEVPQPDSKQPKIIEVSSVSSHISPPVSPSTECITTSTVSEEKEPFDGVIISIAEADFTSPLAKDTVVNVPYQAAIHDKNLNDSKLKKFEALKSPNDLIIMKTIQKLKHFFRCGVYNCEYTTNFIKDFTEHLNRKHNSKTYHCCYCLKEDLNCLTMAEHIASAHHKLIYQCSKCFYRGYSRAHVRVHIKNYHVLDSYTDIVECKEHNVSEGPECELENLNTTWPYVCAIGQCDFTTYDPKEFKKHNETIHIAATQFYCHYCKVDFVLFKCLMNHYRLHGLNLFQCNYCIHGAETKEEILIHLCNMHADQPLKAYMRGSKEEVLSEIKELNTVMSEESVGLSLEDMSSAKKDVLVENPSKNAKKDIAYTGCENELYHVIDNKCYPRHLQSVCYPRYLKNLLSDIICGIPFCNEKFQDMHFYISHLRNVHDALNFACPHCPEMHNTWEDFKNHLLCHCSKLYACGSKECDFYDWDKDKVKEHKKMHQDSDYSIFSVRDFSPTDEEEKLHNLSLNTEFPNVKSVFVCTFCKYKSGDQKVMKNHIYREIAYQRFDCSLCEKKCVSRKDIKDHFISSHPDMVILSSVDYNIEVEAVVKLVLTQHQEFQDVKLAESCDMCCRKFQNQLQLQCHLYICLQKKYRPYECHHCKKSFVNLLALKYHIDKEHYPKTVAYTFTPNYAIEDDIEKNLLKVRLKHLKDILEEKKLDVDTEEKAYKIYSCSDCTFEAHHKFNIQRHNEEKHKGVASIKKGKESNECGNIITLVDENSDEISSENLGKRYSCGFCIKKMLTVLEVEKHMRKVHTMKNNECFYYYSPNANKEFSNDKETYECAYCKSGKDSLSSLKKHADLLHTEMEFKVKGIISCTQPENNYLACGYCYLKFDSNLELHEHSNSSHPSLTVKSIGDIPVNKNKHANQSSNDFPNKRAKFDSTAFVCSHCHGAFSSMERVTLHSKKSHSRLKLEFTELDLSSSGTKYKFYKCEFCKFTAERHFLDQHLSLKHKMRVTCSYCARRFEFASKLKEHHEVHHKNLPIKYSQETLNVSKASSTDLNQIDNDDSEKSKSDTFTTIPPPSFSHYGRNSKSVDLNSLTVHMETGEDQSNDLPVSYVKEHFNMSPKVVLEDVMKKNTDYL